MSRGSERGAAAVEFAILAPVLLLLLLGIMEFGRAYNAQITLSNAAREGVRVMAINNNEATAKAAAVSASSVLNPSLSTGMITLKTNPVSTPATCAAGRQVTVTIDYSLTTMTGIAGPFAMKGVGTMQCGG